MKYIEREYEFNFPTADDFAETPGIAEMVRQGRPLNMWWMPFDIWLDAFLHVNSKHLQDYFWLTSVSDKLAEIRGASSTFIGTARELARRAWLLYSENILAIEDEFFKDENIYDILEATDMKYGNTQKQTDDLNEQYIKEAFETCVPLKYDTSLTFNGIVYSYAVELLNKFIERGLPIQKMYYNSNHKKVKPFQEDWRNHTFAECVFLQRKNIYDVIKHAFKDLCSEDYDGRVITYEDGKKEPNYYYYKVVIKPISTRDVRVSMEINLYGETSYYYYEDSDDSESLIRKYKLNKK